MPTIGLVEFTARRLRRLQTGNRDPHGLRAYAFSSREHRQRCGAITLQAKEDRFLSRGEIPRMRLLSQPSVQFAKRNTKPTR